MDAKDYRKSICYGVGTQKELSITTKLITKEVKKMSWSSSDYNKYIPLVEYAANHGTKEGLESIYREMLAQGCPYEELLRIDHLHNSSFSIL